jgi:hypothetical protein
MRSLFIGAGPTPITDPWAAVEAECTAKLGRQAHAGRLHIHGAAVAGSGRRAAVRCIAWRPLSVGERATDAWTSAALHRVRVLTEERMWILGEIVLAPRAAWPLEVPDAREAEYPPPEHMRFQMSDGAELDAKAAATAAAASAYYARVLRPAPAPCRAPRRPAWARAAS